MITKARYYEGETFAEFMTRPIRSKEMWVALSHRLTIPIEISARVEALHGQWHLLVLSEDWCGDAVNTVPIVAKLVERCPNVDMRVLARDANPDLMDAHLTGGSRSIPVIIVLDEAYEERAWWGPRPTALQRWVSGQGQLLEKTARYREARTWYARDRGRTTLDEVVSMLERAASTGVAAG